MNVTQLPQAIEQQFIEHITELSKSGADSHESTVTHRVNDVGVEVLVTFSREKLQGPPEGAAFCGGKLCKDTATVEVNPANREVASAIEKWIKDQRIPGGMCGPERSQFDEASINGEALEL